MRSTRPTRSEDADPFAADDTDDVAKLKAWCRALTLRRVLGDTRVALQATPDTSALRAEVFEVLEKALGELGERERSVIDLHHWQGLTWKQVGDQMGISERHAKRIDKGLRERLERGLRRRGVDEAPPSANG